MKLYNDESAMIKPAKPVCMLFLFHFKHIIAFCSKSKEKLLGSKIDLSSNLFTKKVIKKLRFFHLKK